MLAHGSTHTHTHTRHALANAEAVSYLVFTSGYGTGYYSALDICGSHGGALLSLIDSQTSPDAREAFQVHCAGGCWIQYDPPGSPLCPMTRDGVVYDLDKCSSTWGFICKVPLH